jgi:uncharacterized protein (DUF427 family)
VPSREARHAHGSVRVERVAKRLRTYLGGELVADTISPLLVWEVPYYPTYYIPAADIRAELIEQEGVLAHSPSRGDARTFTVSAGGERAAGAALRYEESPIEELRDAIRIDWGAMDAWFEEDEEVYTHPRDPHTRVDILASSRHVLVRLAGVILADSHGPRLLFETGLPVRYYLPKPHVRMDLLESSGTITHCPYKGRAQAFDIRLDDGLLHEELAWHYPTPLPESQKIAGLVAFCNEKLDIEVDGELQPRPSTKFS